MTDGEKEKVITAPFENSTLSLFFARPSWSPDGQYLVASAGMKKHKHVAPIIHRTQWSSDMEFVGHKAAITCARFSPTIFKHEETPYLYCALASQDYLVSIWRSDLDRPFLVLKNLFERAPVDMTWTSNGSALLVSSQDGSVGICQFKPEEIGEQMPQSEVDLHWRQLYGDSKISMSVNLIEDPDFLAMEAEIEKELHSRQKAYENNAPSPTKPKSAPTQQIETRLPGGKRRIQPIFLDDLSDIPIITSFSPQNVVPLPPPAPKEEDKSVKEEQPKGILDDIDFCTSIPQSFRADKEARHFIESPEIRQSFRFKFGLDSFVEVVIEGLHDDARLPISNVVCIENSLINWRAEIVGIVVCIAASSQFFVLGCYSGDFHVLSRHGIRALPCMSPDNTPIVDMELHGSCLLTQHCSSIITLWDLEAKTQITKTSGLPLIKNEGSVDLSVFIIEGHIGACVGDNTFHLYSMDLDCWVRIFEDSYLLSDYAPLPFFNRENIEGLQHKAVKKNDTFNVSNLITTSDELLYEKTKVHLEDQISISQLFRLPSLKKWEALYTKYEETQ